MVLTEKQLDIIAQIYNTAIDQSCWAGVLDQISREIGAKGGVLLLLDTIENYDYSVNAMSSMYSALPSDVISHYVQDLSIYEKAHFERVRESPAGQIIKEADTIENIAEFKNRPDVAHLERHAGVFERFAVRLNQEPSWFDCATFQYSNDRQNITRQEHEILDMFLPHMAKATELSRTFMRLRNKYGAVLSVLDRLLIGVVLVLPSGEIVLENESANVTLSKLDGVTKSRLNKLTLSKENDRNRLNTAIRKACNVVRKEGRGESTKMVVPKISSYESYMLDIAPLIDVDNEVESNFKGAMVTIIDPDANHNISIGGLKQVYGLSDAEASVAQLMFDGKKYEEISEVRNVGIETVKTQVNSVYLKTNARSRSELFSKLYKLDIPIL